MEQFSAAKSTTLRGVSSLGAFLSVCGSTLIVCHIIVGKRHKRNPLHRLILGLSVVDALFSGYLAIASVFLYPMFTPSPACTLDAFVQGAGFASLYYNSAISFYYVSLVRWNVKESQFAKRYELLCHTLALLGALVPATAGIFLGIYNPKDSGQGCWIQAYPLHCEDDEATECTRGGKTIASIFPLLTTVLPMLFVILSMAINNFLLYRFVRRLELRSERYSFSARSATLGHNRSRRPLQENASKSRQIATQSLLYVAAFWLCFGFGLVLFIAQMAGKSTDGSTAPIIFAIQVLALMLYPAQGFFNALVYIRPYYIRWRKGNESRLGALGRALFSTDPPPRLKMELAQVEEEGGELDEEKDIAEETGPHEKDQTDLTDAA